MTFKEALALKERIQKLNLPQSQVSSVGDGKSMKLVISRPLK